MDGNEGHCKDCRYAAGDEKSFLTGRMECHRYPPGLKGVDALPGGRALQTWCGEFSPAEG